MGGFRSLTEWNVKNIESGIMPYGKYKDKEILDLPESYIKWVLDNPLDEETNIALIQYLEDNYRA